MKLLGQDIAPLGMGCWPIGGPMFNGEKPLGYSGSNDREAIRTIHAALDAGVRIFDTAAAYGAGHAERLLGEALKGRRDALVISKIGLEIDEQTKQVGGPETDPATVLPAIENCLRRMQRDCLDIVLLHVNALPVEEAMPIFDQMEAARQSGKIRGYGWSTDFSSSALSLVGREGVIGIEHAMNVFFDAESIQKSVEKAGFAAFIRSPLAMGLLSGKYDRTSIMPDDDIRSTGQQWLSYYKDGRPNPDFLEKLDKMRELLQSGGRTLVQGAICWLWAKSERNIPLPGARTVAQIEGTAGALRHGPLPAGIMVELEGLIDRTAEEQEAER